MPVEHDAELDFEVLFRNHWKRVYSVLLRLVGDAAEAEDMALEVFWQLYRRFPGIQAERNVAGWLYRTATNQGLNALRAQQRRNHYEDAAGRLVHETTSPLDPALEAERNEEREQVRQVLGHMKVRSAQLLILRHSGFSYSEVAQALDVSPGSVGTMLARAEREFEQGYRELEEG